MMENNTQRDFNTQLKYHLKDRDCPLQDSDFISALELFLYNGRTPESAL